MRERTPSPPSPAERLADITVVGDAMLDIYRVGIRTRSNPEAPSSPVIEQVETTHGPGGAGNVARWAAAAPEAVAARVRLVHLGGGATGDDLDAASRRFSYDMSRTGTELCSVPRPDGNTPFPVKERIGFVDVPNQTVRLCARLDRDDKQPLTETEREGVLAAINASRPKVCVAVDYRKAIFRGPYGQDLRVALATLPGSMLVVNSKMPDRWWSIAPDVLICNAAEWKTSYQNLSPSKMMRNHLPGNRPGILIVTAGEFGATGYAVVGERVVEVEVDSVAVRTEIKDVSGAGDAFLAGVALVCLETLGHRGGDVTEPVLQTMLARGTALAAACCYQIGCGTPPSKENPCWKAS